MHVGTLEKVQYDMIIGTDLLEYLQINIKYSNSSIEWDTAEIPMRSRDATIEEAFHIQDTPCLEEASERIKQILDAKYEPANLDEITAECTNLNTEEKHKLKSLLTKFEHLFD